MRTADENDIVNLRWAVAANASGKGLYGPSVKKRGPLPECKRLVDRGWVVLRMASGDAGGYWITDIGLAHLNQTEQRY